jgi:hypothetical protein
MLFSASYATLAIMAATEAEAQTTTVGQGQATSQLPPVQITAPEERRRHNPAPAHRADRAGPRRRSQVARRPVT